MKNEYIFLLIIVSLALVVAWQQSLLPTTFEAVDGCEAQTLIPILGRFQCEEYAFGVQSYHNFDASGQTFVFGDTENAPVASSASVSCEPPMGLETAVRVNYQVDGSSICEIGAAEWCRSSWGPGDVYRLLLTDVSLGSRIRLYCSGNTLTSAARGGSLRYTFDQFALYQYYSGARDLVTAGSCKIDNLDWAKQQSICTSGMGRELTEGGAMVSCKELEDTTRIPFGGSVNYVWKWATGPSELNLVDRNKDGTKDAWCQAGGILYSLGDIVLQSGCYKYPAGVLTERWDCCPGEQGANWYCSSDGARLPLDGAELDCPIGVLQCFGQGNWIPNYGTDTHDIIRYECVDSKCKIAETQAVECTPPNLGCPLGQVCDPTQGYICVLPEGPEIVCGDGVCSAPYEDVFNCPADCKVPPIPDYLNQYLILIIPTALGALLMYSKKKDYTDATIGAVIGLVVGLVLQWINNLPDWVKFLGGLGIGVGSGVIIYLFGGAILVFIISFIKKSD